METLYRKVSLTVLLCGVLAFQVHGSASPPNILFLIADDQRADTIGAWGNNHIKTPNLDELAAEGFSFRQNYCFGSNSAAVCLPSRAMLMSGYTWFNVDNRLSDQRVILLPELLRRNGYATYVTGKWQRRLGDTLELSQVNTPPPSLDLTGTFRKPDRFQPNWIVEKYF